MGNGVSWIIPSDYSVLLRHMAREDEIRPLPLRDAVEIGKEDCSQEPIAKLRQWLRMGCMVGLQGRRGGSTGEGGWAGPIVASALIMRDGFAVRQPPFLRGIRALVSDRRENTLTAKSDCAGPRFGLSPGRTDVGTAPPSCRADRGEG